MRIVLWIPVDIYKNAVLPAVQDVEGVEIAAIDDASQLSTALDGASGIISAGASKYTPEVARIVAERGEELRWFQTVAAGNDGFVNYGVPDHLQVTGTGGHSAPVVAEHAMALLLAIAHCVPEQLSNMAEGKWDKSFRPRYRSMYGRTALVVGLGNIGREIADRAKAFGMNVIGANRDGRGHPSCDRCVKIADLAQVAGEVDAVLVALALNPDTRHVIDGEVLRAMKPSAFLVNIARGGLVDQDALAAALADGTIAGAGLDVTDPEPLPDGHPFWNTPNLIISPHLGGGGSEESPRRLAANVRANLERFRDGQPLENLLPFGANAR